jgi:hypothetical protein
MATLIMKLLADWYQFSRQHRLTTGDHHVLAAKPGHLPDNLRDRQVVASRIPGGVRCVTEPAAEIASGGSQKGALCASQQALAL